MKRALVLVILALVGAVAPVSAQFTFNFASTEGATIVFDGADTVVPGGIGTFTFDEVPFSYDFDVTNSTGGALNGLTGTLGGTFYIQPFAPAATMTAVTGTGTLTLMDGANFATASFEWEDIFALDAGILGFGLLNPNGVATNITFTSSGGTNLALHQLVGSVGTIGAQFSESPGLSLTELTTSGGVVGNYSGTVALTLIPEPSSYALILTLLSLGFVAYRRIRTVRAD